MKKGNGEGTIYQRKDGSWCCQKSLNGKRISAYGRTKTEARTKLQKNIETALLNGTVQQVKSKQMTIEEYSKIFLDGMYTIRETTKYNYTNVISRINKYVGNVKLSNVKQSTMDYLISCMVNENNCSSTISNTITMFLRLCESAKEERYISQTVKLKKSGKYGRKTVHTLPPIHDVVNAINRIPNAIIRSMGLFCLLTGLRRGELVALKWEDIDMETGVLTVHNSIAVGNKKLIYGIQKNNIDGQRVQCPKEAIEVIKNLQQYYQEKCITSEYVFSNRKGNHYDPTYITHMFKNAFSGICDKGSIHLMRHLNATMLASLGIPIRTISMQLRHSSVSMTDRYINKMLEESREEIKYTSVAVKIAVKLDKYY